MEHWKYDETNVEKKISKILFGILASMTSSIVDL